MRSLITFIISFVIFGFIFYGIHYYLPEVFALLVTWAEAIIQFILEIGQLILAKFRDLMS